MMHGPMNIKKPLNLCSSLTMINQVSHLRKTRRGIIFMYILVIGFFKYRITSTKDAHFSELKSRVRLKFEVLFFTLPRITSDLAKIAVNITDSEIYLLA